MMKRKVIVIMVLVLCIGLSACGTKNDSNIAASSERPSNSHLFILLEEEYISDGLLQYILYDPQDKIMYTYVHGINGGGLSPLYNKDGTPMLYNPN